jgi:parallel beta-helix repeat protein
VELLSKPVSGILLFLLSVSTLTVAFNIQPVRAGGTIYIRSDGSVEGTDKIVTADNVTYTFIGNITDSIVVERDNIILDGTGYTLQGTGAPGSKGIDLISRTNVTVRNIQIINFHYGIYLVSSSNNNIISGNNITANKIDGVKLDSSSNNTISGNNITNNRDGVRLDSSSNGNTISGNNITNNRDGVLLWSSSNNTISGNNITNNYYGVRLDSSNNTISGNCFVNDGLIIWDSYNNVVVDNTVNGKPLVYLEGVSNYTVSDAGQVILVKCSNITVKGLNLSRASVGLQLFETSNSTITENNITANNEDGVVLDSSSNNIISGNNITNNCYYYFGPGYYSGIYLEFSSNNSISCNNIRNNTWGVGLYSSSNNAIFHNNFINNKENAKSAQYFNAWDNGYPSGGNYWSDYTGADANGDGIGDDEYVIDANNTDRYPLTGPITVFYAGTWNKTAYNVDVVSDSTVSDFHFNPDEGPFLRFNVSGDDGTAGFCRVTIPKDLLWVEDGQWSVLVSGQSVNYTIIPDENHTYIYFTYNHTTKTVEIQGTHVIPEFPYTPILILLMLTTLIATILQKKKRKTKPQLP